MGYLHIPNLYRPEASDIFLFKEVYALEKIHGTSAHVKYDMKNPNWGPKEPTTWVEDGVEFTNDLSHAKPIKYFSGGESHDRFVALFDEPKLLEKFRELGLEEVTVYGEAYGGKQQGMRETYGPDLKFVAFDVKVGDNWLNVPDAEALVKSLGLEFVHYDRISTDLEKLNDYRDAPSEQAIRNGIGSWETIHSTWKKREGIVIRPLIELVKKNGERIIAKHKRDDFRETKSIRQVNAKEVAQLAGAQAIAEEYVTEMRLSHVLDKLPGVQIQDTPKVMAAMMEDVGREASGEFEWTPQVRKAISTRTAKMFKQRITQVRYNPPDCTPTLPSQDSPS